MRKVILPLIALTYIQSAFAEEPRYALKTGIANPPVSADATYADIKSTLGIVPSFLKQYPPASITGAWKEMKAVQVSPETAIPTKYKELIGLAVASQIPCKFCTLFHTDVAKFAGGTPAEINEAIAIAASCRQWSTFFSGIDYDTAKFRTETDLMVKTFRERASQNPSSENISNKEIFTAAEARKDMEATLGFVPGFINSLPEAGVAGAWEDFKTLELSPSTALPAKYKNLISLSVSAQIPCDKCVYWDTQAAKLNGATEQEISEAITMSSLTRKWSTVLNGQNTEEAAFKKELSKIVAHLNEGKRKQK